jgi:hypothetical protein
MSQTGKDQHPALKYQRGQGIVEYILLLVIIISIGYAILNQLFKPVSKWTEFYIGQYIDCLLDQGELPKLLGSEEVDECDYQSLTEGGVDSGKKNRDRNGSSNREDNTQSQANNKQSEPANDPNVSGSDSATAGRSARNKRLRISRGSGADFQGGNYNSSGKRVNIGNIESKIGEDSGSNSETGFSSNLNASIVSQMRRRQNRVTRVTGLAGRFYEYQMESKNRRRSPIMIPKEKLKNELESEQFGEPRSKKLVIDTTSRKSKEIKFEEDTGWSFGRLFRIALIILFILVIVWVVGSQLAQVSKNME